MTFNQLLQTLRLAMQDKQPQLYKQMEAAGTLDEWLENLTAQMVQQVSEAGMQAASALSLEHNPQFEADPMAMPRKIETATKQAEEIALQQAIEQIEAMTTESSPAS